MQIDITDFVNAALVVIAMYIGARGVALLVMINRTLNEIQEALRTKEDSDA